MWAGPHQSRASDFDTARADVQASHNVWKFTCESCATLLYAVDEQLTLLVVVALTVSWRYGVIHGFKADVDMKVMVVYDHLITIDLEVCLTSSNSGETRTDRPQVSRIWT